MTQSNVGAPTASDKQTGSLHSLSNVYSSDSVMVEKVENKDTI